MQERLLSGKKGIRVFHWALKFFAAKKLKEKESCVFCWMWLSWFDGKGKTVLLIVPMRSTPWSGNINFSTLPQLLFWSLIYQCCLIFTWSWEKWCTLCKMFTFRFIVFKSEIKVWYGYIHLHFFNMKCINVRMFCKQTIIMWIEAAQLPWPWAHTSLI